jgi:hypothetical protein
MRGLKPFLIVACLTGATGGPALAFGEPGFDTPAPIQHVQEARYADTQTTPYPMNYADDAARTLGVKDGRMQFTGASADPLMPSVNGGVDSGRPMLKLQWR